MTPQFEAIFLREAVSIGWMLVETAVPEKINFPKGSVHARIQAQSGCR